MKLETRNLKLVTLLFAIILVYDSDRIRPATARRAASHHRSHQAGKQERRRHAGVLHREALHDARRSASSTWSPDGKQIAFISNISGRNNLWLVPATGGWPTQLTISDQRQSQPVWSPDGTWIAYISDHDGDEQWDIFLVSPKTGDVVNLTTSPESRRGRAGVVARRAPDRLHHQAQDRLELTRSS